MFYQEKPYFTGDKIKILRSKYKRFGKHNAQFFISILNKAFSSYSWGSSSFDVKTIGKQNVSLPIKQNGQIDFDFIESFAQKIEKIYMKKLEAYLSVAGLNNYVLTHEEEKVLENFKNWNWCKFNLEKLFGKSTRGKRLKSEDRIAGKLPFVTAGEADEGVSAYIAGVLSRVFVIFSKNFFNNPYI